LAITDYFFSDLTCAAVSCSIKDLVRSSPFKKSERGKFEAKIVAHGIEALQMVALLPIERPS
jgi:hypothetical protein